MIGLRLLRTRVAPRRIHVARTHFPNRFGVSGGYVRSNKDGFLISPSGVENRPVSFGLSERNHDFREACFCEGSAPLDDTEERSVGRLPVTFSMP